MKWPWINRKRAALTAAAIEEIVRRETARIVDHRLLELTHEMVLEVGGTGRQTEMGQMIRRIVRNTFMGYVRMCRQCGQPFLVPRLPSQLSDPYEPGPSDERMCEEHRAAKP